MRFEIKHTFRHAPDAVAKAMFHPDAGGPLSERMSTIIEVEPLSRDENGDTLDARVRYLPVPMIKRVGPKKVDPKWMEWIAEFRFAMNTMKGTYRNVPTTGRVARLMENGGALELTALPNGGTERILTGELKVKVPLLGRIAEKIIYKNAVEILDEEAKILQQLLDEGALT